MLREEKEKKIGITTYALWLYFLLEFEDRMHKKK